MIEPRWDQIRKQRIRDQVQTIWNEFRQKGAAAKVGEPGNGGIDIGVQPTADGVGFMYAEGQLLVRENYVERVVSILDGSRRYAAAIAAHGASSPPGEPVIDGVVVLRLPKQQDGSGPSVLDALELIDGVLGPGYATPNHVITVAGDAGPCPATEPEQAYDGIEPYPSVATGDAGAGISVYVADTGLLWYPGDQPPSPDTTQPGQVVINQGTVHSWLKGVRGSLDPNQDPASRVITLYEGHGTFVAGVARCMAPAADIFVANAFNVAGSTLETDLVRRLDAALAQGFDLFHLSIEAPTRNDLPLISFESWLRRMRQYKGVACVVAAGNSGSSLPSWPAAFPEVVSVGALAADWRSRALFSNYGPWVDVYAPGRDLVNAFATGTYTCKWAPYKDEVRKFFGMAKWSGTSFSTPIVTGLIAARMSRTGENGQEAAAAILAQARSRAIPGVGPILLPYDGSPLIA
jgi:subtilisin family serine protease